MWTELATFLKANASETLLVSVIGTTLVWLYKQFKSMIEKKEQNNREELLLRQGLFTKLELSIASALHLKNEGSKQQMYTIIGECGPYWTSTQRKVIRDYYKQFDPLLLQSLQDLAVAEVDKIDRELKKIRENENDGDWFVYIKNLYRPFGPIFLFGIIVLYVLFFMKILHSAPTFWNKFSATLFGASIFLSVTLLVVIPYLFLKSELGKQGILRWCMSFLIIVSPLLLFIANYSYTILLIVVIQIASLIIFVKSKRPTQIILP